MDSNPRIDVTDFDIQHIADMGAGLVYTPTSESFVEAGLHRSSTHIVRARTLTCWAPMGPWSIIASI